MHHMEHIWTMVMLKFCNHTFYAYLSQIWKLMQFMCFIRKVFVTKILLSGKFSLFVTLHVSWANLATLTWHASCPPIMKSSPSTIWRKSWVSFKIIVLKKYLHSSVLVSSFSAVLSFWKSSTALFLCRWKKRGLVFSRSLHPHTAKEKKSVWEPVFRYCSLLIRNGLNLYFLIQLFVRICSLH